MCGFAGIYERGLGEGAVDPALLDRMGSRIRHRGPDDDGVWVAPDRRIGLAHRRLAIVDPAGGRQPMEGPTGEVLVFNGEIYNYPALRRELEADGARFRTDCDTEVILHVHARDGAAGIKRLEGAFAFALWDPGAEELLLARDPVGEKPLYWTEQGGRLIFASEIKAILEHPQVTAETDRAAIGPYLANLVAPAPATMFAGISKLPPGSLLRASASDLSVREYRSMRGDRRFEPTDPAAAAERVLELFESSVEARLMSDVPVGVLLSGGLDSGALVATLAEHGRRLPTFSIGYEGGGSADEREPARRLAAHFGAEHHEVELTEQMALGFLEGMVDHADEPLGDPVSIPLHFVCAAARDHDVKVLLGGEGSDELFWGYPSYARILRAWPAVRLGLALPGAFAGAGARVAAAGGRDYIAEGLEGIASGRPHSMHQPLGLPRQQREELLGGPCGLGWEPALERPGESALETIAHDTHAYELGLRLPELLLMRLDRYSMSSGVEARVPFLAPDLVDYAATLDPSHKLQPRRGPEGKIVFREAIGSRLPDWVLERPKQGFGPPVGEWIGSRIGALLQLLLADGELDPYIDREAALAVAAAGRFNAWPVLNLALWHRRWIRGEPIQEAIERVG